MIKILHLSTGGTIEGDVPEYAEVSKLAKIYTNTIDLPRFVQESMQVAADYSHTRVCKKDSRDITDEDRAALVTHIQQAYESGTKHILITHGTYTMSDTGRYLLEHLSQEEVEDISIVITGAMYPANIFGSDALMNMGSAISSLLNASEPLGIVVNMHGKNYDPRKITKNTEALIFEDTGSTN